MATINELINKINFGDNINGELFSNIAENAARECSGKDNTNKSTQIRKFYDELVMWNEKIQNTDNPQQKFLESKPYIQMLRAKAAYAKGRKLIDDKFYQLFDHCIQKVDHEKKLAQCKLFLEAFIGFKKYFEKSE